MKAAVFHAPGTITCDTVDDPVIQDANDIILRVTSTAICGSDLHMLFRRNSPGETYGNGA